MNGERDEVRHGGFATKREAPAALDAVIRRRDMRVTEDSKLTTGEYLTDWTAEQCHRLKPTTWFNYDRYVRLDIVPAVGSVPLQQHHDHIRHFVADLVAAGRGATTVRRIIAVLSSALADAVQQRRVLANPATHVILP
ncbi:MAG: N-terminal phage integrase SAM-like domain-containing protein [Actinomycetota bacterium]|nr:N-terminal phage integrase SAM-like domain-containing protein [Actinomycetota bacterium]